MKDCNIIYTDDDQDDLDLFQSAMNVIGKDVLLFDHADKMLTAINTPPPPCLIFLDLNMPGKDGFSTLAEIRSQDRFANIPVIIFSTSKSEANVNRAWDLGANYYMSKSFSFDTMVKSIRMALSIDWKNFKPMKSEFFYSA